MKILISATSYPPSTGGAQLHIHQIATHLHKRNSIDVVSFWNKNRSDWLIGTTLRCDSKTIDYQIDGIEVHKIGLSLSEKKSILPWVIGYYPFMRLAVPVIARLVQTKITGFSAGVDLIHNVRIGREPLSYASMYEAHRLDVPFVLTPVHHPRWSGWLHRLYHDLYKQADAVIVLTQSEKDELIRLGVSPKNIYITGIGPLVGNHPQPDRFRQQSGIGNVPFVLFLGQKYPYKGVRELLAAADLVWAKYPETRFVFIGPPTAYSDKLFSENKDTRVIEMGIVDIETKTDALAACDMLCVPSSQESFGGVYTEAWSFGRPVIGCSIPAVKDVITDGTNGFLVNQDPSEIADRIVTLLSDKSLALSFGQNGKKEVESKYTWDRLAKLTEDIYHSVMYGI